MNAHTGSSSQATIQISPESVPSTPSWFGEVTAFAQVLGHVGILKAIQEQVRFARARFGQYDLIDFVVVLISYVLSGEPTLLAFYERLAPWASPFMALFGRDRLPHRSTLSRFLAALDQPTVEALRKLFQEDLVARKPFASPGGTVDRTGQQWWVVDVDGTRATARQRALPQIESLPAPHRRYDQVCAPGYQGRKRGEVVRTRTVVLQAHTHQFLGTFGAAGNGDYRGELRRAVQVITTYATQLALPLTSVLLRLDGLYGDAAPLLDVLGAGLGVIARSRAYHLLDVEAVKQVLARAPSHVSTHPESGMTRVLYDCASIPLTSAGPQVRVVIATHDATSSPPAVGVERDGTVYELFVSTLPSPAFAASDVLDLYLHRGSFETVLADEDDEQESDRWYSHTPCGQEFAQILAQWVWNIRLELGQQLSATSLRITEFAPALEVEAALQEEPGPPEEPTPSIIYGPPQWAHPSFTGGFPSSAFTPQPDGTLRCPANHLLYPQERRPERNGSLRVLYAARIGHCRFCPLRAQCQESSTTIKPRRVSAVMWPLSSSRSESSLPADPARAPLPAAPVLWRDWPRCSIRRTWLKAIRSQTICVESSSQLSSSSSPCPAEKLLTRAERAHWRLSWIERLARNARPLDAPRLVVTLHGLPAIFASSFGFDLLATA
ncbi:hypothetical protein KSC_000210 [Ktedonobacter sp. SOSP1-52]|uniref:hypothetical protein n=1 Tax=Ktedonobacter sp. SOSP1-52 TaxID=2778366 RepID=UPI00191683A7|nr:hypothetical protein [Ktedonobacter sp. SOSP1-52]GHO61129.1 hypothetical protein KSC_000210 [Ktedonobacter sp. SOSP1-52]